MYNENDALLCPRVDLANFTPLVVGSNERVCVHVVAVVVFMT